jgi:eukaryotic-like serine/threonine-protein kinase
VDQIGKYTIQDELGRGGFGTVYRGWDPEMRRAVAIKVLNLSGDSGYDALARFRSEAATTANLHHRNIITIYDSGEHDGHPWFAMEFLDGRTLRKALEDSPALELWEKVNILLQIAEGLLYAHDHGVVHRDIKPANVMLMKGSAVKVLDFGIARLTDPESTQHMTATGMIQGTFGYLAPEQLEGARGDQVSDIFSFGVVCYETLTGLQPFHANSLVHSVNLIANFNPEPVNKLVRDCPPRLAEIVHKALAKDPARRYRSLRELILDLAPVEVSLRTARATELAGEAEALLRKSDNAGARALLDRALLLDRLNKKAQALRSRLPAAPGEDLADQTATIRLSVVPPQGPPASRTPRLLLAVVLLAIVAAAIGFFYFMAPSKPPATPIAKAPPTTEPVVQPPPAPAPEPAPPAAPSPADALRTALRSRDWDAARVQLDRVKELNPDDPRVKDWQNQIDKGSSQDRKVASLHASISDAIKSANWKKAESQIVKLKNEQPDDPAVPAFEKAIDNGIRQAPQAKALLAAVKADIKAKRWDDADRDLNRLLSLAPGDPDALHQKSELAKKRP